MDTKDRADPYTDAPAHHSREYVATGIALHWVTRAANPQAKKPFLVQKTAFYSVRPTECFSNHFLEDLRKLAVLSLKL
jgi:hypothetical protein